MTHQPKKWIAALLGLLAAPLAMLYLARWKWAGIYLLLALILGVVGLHESLQLWSGLLQLAFVITAAVHAYRTAARWPAEAPRPIYSRWYGVLGGLFAIVGLTLCVRAFGLEPFAIPAGSMLPTLSPHSNIVVQKWGYGNYGSYGIQLWRTAPSQPVARGDVLVFEFPEDRSVRFVKRVVGMPGDRIEYRGKQLKINGQVVPQRPAGAYYDADSRAVVAAFIETQGTVEYTILMHQDEPQRPVQADDFAHRDQCTYDLESVVCTVPVGHYFMMGDNRDNSRDSRFWGFLPADHIVGKVQHVMR